MTSRFDGAPPPAFEPLPPPWAAAWGGLLDSLSDALLLLDARGCVVRANTAALRLLPCSAGTPLEDLRDALGDAALQWLKRAVAGAPPAGDPPALRPRGDSRVVHLSWSRLDAQHSALRLQPEAATAPSQVPAGPLAAAAFTAYRDAPFPALLQGPDERLLDVNQAFVDFSGHARERLIGLDPLQLLPDEDRAVWRAARAAGRPPPLEGRFIDAGGRERWYRSVQRPVRDASGRMALLSVLQDATGEHVASERAERSARELDDWFDLSPVGMVLFDASGLLVRTNPAFDALAGSAPVSLDLAPAALRQLLAWGEGALAALHPGAAPLERHAWLEPDRGAARRLRSVVRCYRSAGGQVRYMAIVEDRSVEEERDLAQLQLFALMDTAGVGVATFQESAGWLRPPQAPGSAPASAALQNISRDLVVAESLPEYERLQQALRQMQRVEVRYAIRHPEAGLRWLLTRVEPATLAGKRTTSVVTLDITEQQLARQRSDDAEQAVALQAEHTRAILDSVLVGIVTVGARGIEWMNRSAQRMFGAALGDFIGQPIACVATPEPEHPFRRAEDFDERAEGQVETFECRLRARDGREFWIVGNVVATGSGAGRQLTYALLDVERRRQAEARMSAAQASLQRIIEAAPFAIALIDAEAFSVLQANQLAAQSLGRATLEGCTPEQLFTPEVARLCREDLRAALTARDVTIREYRDTSQPPRVWDARYLPLASVAGGAPDQLLLVASDVTEQRAAQEARLEAAIAQREMLVREVHHRIKNNLQGVAGLLQQIAQAKPEVAPAIAEVVGQVQAIAHVYGLQVGAGAALPLASVVEAIVGSVQRNFGHAIRVVLQGEARRWTLPEAEAIPIALTVNELLTNAIKHSDRDAAGQIVCTLNGDDASGASLAIANPARLPPAFSLSGFPGGTSGLGLVRALLPRRGATLAIEQHGEQVVASIVLQPPSVARAAG